MNTIFKYLVFLITSAATYFQPVGGLLLLVTLLFMCDFVTGFIKSVKVSHAVRIQSKKLRWSAVKMCVYLSIITLTFFVCKVMGVGMDTAVSVVKIEAWCIVYIEGLSIVENLQAILPKDKFLGFLHYLLSIEFLKVVPLLANFLKEKDDEKV
jgi:phosphatidylglycerophosphate synthase